MTNVCFYFQVHQPVRMRKYSVFDIGHASDYFNDQQNRDIMHKVARKCYLPTNKLMLQLLNKHKDFKIAYSISGTAYDQFKQFAPEVLESFRKLNDTGKVEFLSETYYHSLAYLYDKEEFTEQVRMHQKFIKKEFGQKPKVFRNTELIYNNELAHTMEKMGFKGILAEGWDHYLGWRSPNFVYKSKTTRDMRLLTKNYQLSDDIAFRFSNRGWASWPLTADKYADWLAPNLGDSINLFMDYETFGEHQWEDTGIFEFMKHLPVELQNRGMSFQHPSELLAVEPKDEVDIHHPLSWADVERDVSAWLGNKMQTSAAERLYGLKKDVMNSRDAELIDTWRKLTTSDHLYYMCTKWFNDGDVHKYFNAYDNPYDAYITFMNILNDVTLQLRAEPVSVPTAFKSWIPVNARR